MNLPTLITIPKADICKAEIAQIAQHLIDRINEGEVNPVEAHIKLKAIGTPSANSELCLNFERKTIPYVQVQRR